MRNIALLFTLLLTFNAFAQEDLPNARVQTIDGTDTSIEEATEKAKNM